MKKQKQTREKPSWEQDFECGCHYHNVTFTYYKDKTIPQFHSLFICIYEHRSKKTGKLLKRPKLQGDMVISGKKDISKLIKGLTKLI